MNVGMNPPSHLSINLVCFDLAGVGRYSVPPLHGEGKTYQLLEKCGATNLNAQPSKTEGLNTLGNL